MRISKGEYILQLSPYLGLCSDHKCGNVIRGQNFLCFTLYFSLLFTLILCIEGCFVIRSGHLCACTCVCVCVCACMCACVYVMSSRHFCYFVIFKCNKSFDFFVKYIGFFLAWLLEVDFFLLSTYFILTLGKRHCQKRKTSLSEACLKLIVFIMN